MAYGAYVDGSSLYDQYHISQKTGDYSNTVTEGERIAGGWGGAYVVGTTFAESGAAVGFVFGGPVGAAIVGVGAGAVGGTLGYLGGSYALPRVIKDVTGLWNYL
jgi:hypothetical protein